MITGWCAIASLKGPLPKGTSVFSAVLLKVAAEGVGQTVLAALLLASGVSQAGSGHQDIYVNRAGALPCAAGVNTSASWAHWHIFLGSYCANLAAHMHTERSARMQ